MKFPILTHDMYASTSLIVLILGNFYIANHIHERFLRQLNMQLIHANLVVDFLIVVFGCFIIPLGCLNEAAPSIQILCIFCGIILGIGCLEIESRIIFWGNYNHRSISILMSHQYPYISTVLVGCLEEILYRGYLTVLCFSLFRTYWQWIILIGITLIFALNHINLGSRHVLTKFILGFICLISFLITKTILTPLLIHATFNALTINKCRKLAYAH